MMGETNIRVWREMASQKRELIQVKVKICSWNIHRYIIEKNSRSSARRGKAPLLIRK